MRKCMCANTCNGVCICKCAVGCTYAPTHMSSASPDVSSEGGVAAMACGRSITVAITRPQGQQGPVLRIPECSNTLDVVGLRANL